MTPIEKMARAIANGMGDDFDHAHVSKSEWTATRGQKGGRYRDINEPRQADYLDAARAGLEAIREPTEDVVSAVVTEFSPPGAALVARGAWAAMVDKMLEGG